MKILLVDDDRELVDLLGFAFQRQGHLTLKAFDGEHALRLFKAESPELVVLDLNMPKLDGLNLVREIRRTSPIPILVLSASGDETQVVAALDNGADDFMTKPFRPGELRARVRALLRRSAGEKDDPLKPSRPLSAGSLTLDLMQREVSVCGRTLQLSSKEFSLLYYLMLNRGQALRGSDIIDRVWGYDSPDSEQVLKVTIFRLRKKLEVDSAHPEYIVTVPGFGYRFQAPSDLH